MLPVRVTMIQCILKREAALDDVVGCHSLEGVAIPKALHLGEIEDGCDGSPIGDHRPILGGLQKQLPWSFWMTIHEALDQLTALGHIVERRAQPMERNGVRFHSIPLR
jgi:hypothetical protein